MKKEKINFYSVLKVVFPVIIKSCPVYFLIYAVCDITQGISYGANTFFLQRFFDSIIEYQAQKVTWEHVLLSGVYVAGILVGLQLLNGISNYLFENLINKISGVMNYRVNGKAYKINPILFENVDTLEDILKARDGAGRCVSMVFAFISIFTFHLPYFIYMLLYLYKLKPLLALILLIIFVPMSLSQYIKSVIYLKMADSSVPWQRKYLYYEKCICDNQYFKETYLLGAYSFFNSRLKKSIANYNKEIIENEHKSNLAEGMARSVSTIGYLVLLIVLVDSAIIGDISIGSFSAIFSSVGLVFGVMEAIIMRNLGTVAYNLGQAKNFISFLGLPENTGIEKTFQESKGIELKNLCFRYPDSTQNSLENINMTIGQNETVAIVGENGAGKSTLLKVMLGLYHPSEGSVYIGGLDTKEVRASSIYPNVSAVFQDYQKYKFSVKENVELGDIRLKLSATRKLLEGLGVQIDNDIYYDGLDTILSSEFGGIEISGGIWQRIAIARGLYRNGKYIFLDEPTSAIDPLEENALYRQFALMAKGRTSVIITHRLGVARIADRIIVLDKGRIVESGTHEQLLNLNGKYSIMYKLQANRYFD